MKSMKRLLAVLFAVMIMIPSMAIFATTDSPQEVNNATVKFNNRAYDGTMKATTGTITYNGQTLVEGVDYKIVSGLTHKNAGTYTVTIKYMGKFKGTATASYKITMVKNSVALTQSKSVTYSKTTNWTVATAKGEGSIVSWAVVGLKNPANAKYISVNKTTGKITVKKGAPKGATFRVRIRYSGDTNHYARVTTVTVKVK